LKTRGKRLFLKAKSGNMPNLLQQFSFRVNGGFLHYCVRKAQVSTRL